MYKNPETGQIEAGGGGIAASMAGGALGYELQKKKDKECGEALIKYGFEPLPEEE